MKMWEFSRHVDETVIKELNKQKLWKEKLKDDCERRNVFLAIREGRISFYSRGGRLFEFNGNSFITHIKYTSIIDADESKNYITQEQLVNMKLIDNFIDWYDRIKENCELYSGEEARGISYLYQNSSYLSDENYIVLDIEVAFKNENNNQERIDILLYDTQSQSLRFVEAKHFSNKDLWSNSKPKVIEQIEKYVVQLDLNKEKIIKEYTFYIDGLNKLFNKKLKPPKTIEPKISLLIFGFDDAQKRGDRFQDLIWNNKEYKNIPIYSKGNPTINLKAETIWKGAK
jgi:hypothetical protein